MNSDFDRTASVGDSLLKDTADVLLAHMSRNQIVSEDLPDLIRSVHQALLECKSGAAPAMQSALQPAVQAPKAPPTQPAPRRPVPPLLRPMPAPRVVASRPAANETPVEAREAPKAEAAASRATAPRAEPEKEAVQAPTSASSPAPAQGELLSFPSGMRSQTALSGILRRDASPPPSQASEAASPAPAAARPQPLPRAPEPKVPVEQSIQPNSIICLEDGRPCRDLAKRLWKTYGMSPEEYRLKWQLPPEYPMLAPNEVRRRGELVRYDPNTLQRMRG